MADRSAAVKAAISAGMRRYWQNRPRKPKRPKGERHPRLYTEPTPRATPEQLAEAERRLLAPRSITAELMGDPPAGMSALDKRRI